MLNEFIRSLTLNDLKFTYSFSLASPFLWLSSLSISSKSSDRVSGSCTTSSLTRFAYRKVFRVCSHEFRPGDIIAIMHVLLFSPMNESRSTWVNLLTRNGKCVLCLPKARMHSFSANRDLLISAPSIRVCRLADDVSAPRSFPAKSMNENLP